MKKASSIRRRSKVQNPTKTGPNGWVGIVIFIVLAVGAFAFLHFNYGNANAESNQKKSASVKKSAANKPEPPQKNEQNKVVEKPLATDTPTVNPPETKPPFVHGDTKSQVVYLTFDAGSEDKATRKILATLQKENIQSVFFLTGQFCEKYPAETKAIAEGGHIIGNHSYSHPQFPKLSDEKIKEQISKTEASILSASGKPCARLFRFPYGSRDKRTQALIASLGYREIYWSLDSWDAFKKNITAKEISDRILSKVKSGDVILMHCGSAPTAEALPGIILELRNRGFSFGVVGND